MLIAPISQEQLSSSSESGELGRLVTAPLFSPLSVYVIIDLTQSLPHIDNLT